MADVGREDFEVPGLGWIGGAVQRLEPQSETGRPALPVPHMGWNEIEANATPHALLSGLGEHPHVYFTHSYAFGVSAPGDVAAWCDYGGRFVAAAARGNLFGVQFHPEKSQQTGLRLLSSFLAWRP
jgi:imidazole glycerol-phosphate synthase subunit HisH